MRLLNIVLLVVALSGCGEYKYLQSGSKAYKVKAYDTLTEYSNKKRAKVKLEDKGHYLIIKNYPTKIALFDSSLQHINKPLVSFPAEMERLESLFFPSGGYSTEEVKRLVYDDGRVFISGLTFPVKIRPALDVDVNRYKDSLTTQVETGISLGVAVGYKFSRNWFNSNKNYAGQYTNRVSVAPGGFLSLGATDLKKINMGYQISADRKAVVLSYGGAIVLGFNSVNIGYAFGFDHLLNNVRKYWLYQGKLWHGVTFGIDVIK